MLLALPFLLIVALVLPFLAWASARAMREAPDEEVELPSPDAVAAQITIVQAVVFGAAWLAVRGGRLEVPWRAELTPVTLGTTAALVVLALVVAGLEARRPLGEDELVRRALRRVSPLRPSWVLAVGLTAMTEELAYRFVLTSLLTPTAGVWPAALLSALVFGIGHLAQGVRGAVVSFVFGLALQGLVHLSGGLALAIAAHFVYDLAAAELGRRLQRAEDGPPPPDAE